MCGFCFLIVILIDTKQYHIVVLIVISLMNNDIEYLFIYLLAKHMHFLKKLLCNCWSVLTMWFVVLPLSWNASNVFDSFLFLDMFDTFFLSVHRLPFHCLDHFLCCAVFSLMWSYFFNFVTWVFGVISKKSHSSPVTRYVSPVVSSKSFIIWYITLIKMKDKAQTIISRESEKAFH